MMKKCSQTARQNILICLALRRRLFTVCRNAEQNAEPGYSDGRLTVDFDAKQVSVEGNVVRLTSLEFKLLAYLIKNNPRVISKQELFEQVWGDRLTGDGTLNVHIRKIREAIEPIPGKPEYIITVWGDGYRFSGGKQ